ncbi:tRNA (guanine(9)-/adenine(9)-N1)-methyltransferase [Thermococcus atlanticus]
MIMKKLGKIFAELLAERGIQKIGSLSKRVPGRDSGDKLQEIATAVLEGYGAICRLKKPAYIAWDLEGNPVHWAEYAFVHSSIAGKFEPVLTSEDLKSVLPDYPYFIIDLMHWGLHSRKEKVKVALQSAQSYGVIRDYLWGERLALTWVNGEFKALSNFPLDKITAYEGSTAEFLKEKGIEDVVLLDPRAEKELGQDDLNAGAFVIGGIVDTSGKKKGTTARIGEALENAGIRVRRRKIALRGDIVGVPDRINMILDIMLRILVEGKPAEKAILEVQAPLQARWRLRKELPRRKTRFMVNGKKFLVVERELFDEYSEWLNIRWEDFVKVLKELDFVALERRRIRHLKKISVPRIINGRAYYVILLKKAAMMCYNC